MDAHSQEIFTEKLDDEVGTDIVYTFLKVRCEKDHLLMLGVAHFDIKTDVMIFIN